MVPNEEKQAKLVDAFTRRQGVSGVVGTAAPHALVSVVATPSPTPFNPIVAVPLVAAQGSPVPPPREEDKVVVEIEFDENSAEGPIFFKRRRPMTATTSQSSTVGHAASL